ncbi:FAD dependent oxidoreductase [Hirsutella rhossiliensis]|uniref:FAD dependent oxidoreductase domain-containing protein n=1 Tax=Hirsutella rhossiliensis TaxID=111463 RepID=A0A9P8NAD0_9HYPO|nr:FAD dependent oxidoreductase domain-containing protein [Hirsutella rhossiliensis]KAH0968639.1 FAD dependent oxidoreductase domain-containing protein [Hirsutella rhossiliensis]
MLEAREACWGAAGRNGGHCLPHVFNREPHIPRFELATFEFLQDLVAANDIPCAWRTVGCVRGLTSPEAVEAALVTDKAGLETNRVLALAGAVFQSDAAKCWAYKLVCWLLEDHLQGHPADEFNLQTNTPVTQLRRAESSWTLDTPRGQITANQVLIAKNAYTSRLLARFTDCIVPVRGQICALEAPEDARPLEHTYVWVRGDVDGYLIQRDGGLLILGGERLGGDKGVSRDDEVDARVGRRLRRVLASAVKLKPHGRRENEELVAAWEWTGIMGYSRDGHPWVGPVPERLGGGPGLWVCAGYSRCGMPVAPRCALAVAEMMLGRDGHVHVPTDFIVSEERLDICLVAHMAGKT